MYSWFFAHFGKHYTPVEKKDSIQLPVWLALLGIARYLCGLREVPSQERQRPSTLPQKALGRSRWTL